MKRPRDLYRKVRRRIRNGWPQPLARSGAPMCLSGFWLQRLVSISDDLLRDSDVEIESFLRSFLAGAAA